MKPWLALTLAGMAAVIVAAVLCATRYSLIGGGNHVLVYRIDHWTGTVWLLHTDGDGEKFNQSYGLPPGPMANYP